MTIKDPLGNRMKSYESVSNYMMTHRLPVVVRIDGRAFSKLTKRMEFKKPFDKSMTLAMQRTCMALCEEVQNCRIGYVQSDEISLLLIPYEKHETQPYFGNELQKITSRVIIEEIFSSNFSPLKNAESISGVVIIPTSFFFLDIIGNLLCPVFVILLMTSFMVSDSSQ